MFVVGPRLLTQHLALEDHGTVYLVLVPIGLVVMGLTAYFADRRGLLKQAVLGGVGCVAASALFMISGFDQFIPVAEDCGLILPLGEHLLERAAEELLALRAALVGDLYAAVNLSARQTYDARLFDTIVAIIERTGLPPEGLRLELTESLLMRDFTVTGTLLQRLREHLGTRIAIDDFGTGYSSLSYLKQLPIDTLKVDRSFVRDIPEDTSDMEITSAVIAMARALNKDVIAEGVETQAQLEYPQSEGCGFAQGYLLARPAPPAQFADGPLYLPVDG